MKKRLKPLLPSLREKKRYIAFEVISGHSFDAYDVHFAITQAAKEFLGTLGMAQAGIIPLENCWDPKLQRGIVRVNHKFGDHLKASLVFTKSIRGKEAIVRSIGASGMIKKTKEKYISAKIPVNR